MAIPTNFQGYTPNATVTKSFKIFGSATVGIWGNDVDGTFTPSIINLAPNLGIFMSQAYTDAQIITLLKAYVENQGAGRDGAAGGVTPQVSKQIAITSTTTT